MGPSVNVPPESKMSMSDLIGLGEASHSCLQEIALRSSRAFRLSYPQLVSCIRLHPSELTQKPTVTILDPCHLKHPLRSRSRNDTGAPRRRNKPTHDGPALARDLARHGMRFGDMGSPVTSTDGDDGQLGNDDSAADGGGDFLGALDAEADVAKRGCNESAQSA